MIGDQQALGGRGSRLRHFFEHGSYRPWLAGAVLVILLLGAWMRFSLPQIPITNKDSGSYVSPALSMLVKGTYEPSNRNFPYAGFFWILLKTTGTYTSLVVAQHLLGLIGGLILWLTWLRLRVFFPMDWRISATHAALGVFIVCSLILSPHPIFYEHSIRPEALFPFLISLQLFCAVSFLKRSLVRKSIGVAILWGTLMTIISIGLLVLKPIWGVAVVSGGLPFLIVLGCTQGRARLVPIAAGTLGTLAGLTLFVIPEAILTSSSPEGVSLINQQLFFVHANLAERELRRDLADPEHSPFPREILLLLADEFQAGLSGKCEKPYITLGFNPDDFMYGQADSKAMKYFRHQHGGADHFYRHYYAQSCLHQPFEMLRKVLRELAVFYRFNGDVTHAYKPLDLKAKYEDSAMICNDPSYLRACRGWNPFKAYVDAINQAQPSNQPLKVDVLAGSLHIVNITYLAVLLMFLSAGFLGGRRGGAQTARIPLFWLGLWLYSYNFGMTLTVAIVHSMSIKRYTDTQFSLTIFSFCAGLLIVISLFLDAKKDRHFESQPLAQSLPADDKAVTSDS